MSEPHPSRDTCYLLLTPRGEIVHASPSAAELLGVASDDIAGTPLAEWVRAAERPEWLQRCEPGAGCVWIRQRERGWEEFDVRLSTAALPGKLVLRIARPLADAIWVAAARQAPSGLLLFDARSHGLAGMNAAARRWLRPPAGLEQASLYELLPLEPAAIRAAVRQLEQAPSASLGRCAFADAEGTAVAEARLSRVAGPDGELLCVTLEDAAGTIQLEHKLRQAQKMEELGRVAGGVAHDFNNLLGVILCYADLLVARDQDALAIEAAREIQLAAQRGAAVTSRLLAFSRPQAHAPRVMDLNLVVEGMGNMLQRLIGSGVELALRMDPGLAYCKVDPNQLELVLFNLAVNARDAMPDGGHLQIQTANRSIGNGLREGEYVILSVRDTGVGMSATTRERIFDPFFTTKGVAGTGLGLATVRSTVEQAGGFIQVESAPGQGTEFTLLFPRSREPLAAQENATPRPRLQAAPRILLLEEDRPLRTALAEALRGAGAVVIEMDSADGMGNDGSPPDLLIEARKAAGRGEQGAAAQGRALWPELPVLILTSHPPTEGTPPVSGGVSYLQKPFAPGLLVARVAELLARRRDRQLAAG